MSVDCNVYHGSEYKNSSAKSGYKLWRFFCYSKGVKTKDTYSI